MTDHLTDSATVEHIVKRSETYLHLARRVVVDIFGPEAGHDQVQVVAMVAAMMANLEHAEILASSQDKLTELLERD